MTASIPSISSSHHSSSGAAAVQAPARRWRDLLSELPADLFFALPLTCQESLALAKTNRTCRELGLDERLWQILLKTNYPLTIREYFNPGQIKAKEFCRVHSLFFKSVVKGNFKRYTGFLPDEAALDAPVTRFMFDWKGDTYIFQHLEIENTLNRLEWDLQAGFQEVTLFRSSESLRVEEEVVYLSLPGQPSLHPYFVCSSGSKIFLVDPLTGLEAASLTISYPFIYRVCMCHHQGEISALIWCGDEFGCSIQFCSFFEGASLTEHSIPGLGMDRLDLDTIHLYTNTDGRLFLCYMGQGNAFIYDIDTKMEVACLPHSIGKPKYFKDKSGKAYLALNTLIFEDHQNIKKTVIWDTSNWQPVKFYDVEDFQIISYHSEHYIIGRIDCGTSQPINTLTTISFKKYGLSIWKFSDEMPLITATDSFGWNISDSYNSNFEYEGEKYLLLSHLNGLNSTSEKVMVRVWDLKDGRIIADNNFIAPSDKSLVDLLGIARKKGLPYLLGKKYSWSGNSELYLTGILGTSNKRKRESGGLSHSSSLAPKKARGEMKSP